MINSVSFRSFKNLSWKINKDDALWDRIKIHDRIILLQCAQAIYLASVGLGFVMVPSTNPILFLVVCHVYWSTLCMILSPTSNCETRAQPGYHPWWRKCGLWYSCVVIEKKRSFDSSLFLALIFYHGYSIRVMMNF